MAPPGYGNTSGTPLQGYVYDTTGQVAPPGAKPRVTATLWEDEGSLCYQVEAKGVCVARREGKPFFFFFFPPHLTAMTNPNCCRQPYD